MQSSGFAHWSFNILNVWYGAVIGIYAGHHIACHAIAVHAYYASVERCMDDWPQSEIRGRPPTDEILVLAGDALFCSVRCRGEFIFKTI
jgi:hypothetical protein